MIPNLTETLSGISYCILPLLAVIAITMYKLPLPERWLAWAGTCAFAGFLAFFVAIWLLLQQLMWGGLTMLIALLACLLAAAGAGLLVGALHSSYAEDRLRWLSVCALWGLLGGMLGGSILLIFITRVLLPSLQ
jgi:hypothetical protein